MTTARDQLRNQWLQQQLPSISDIFPLPGDASFRRYFRIFTSQKNYLLMDAPPVLEDSQSFVAIAKAYRTQGIHTPEIFSENLADGFLLIEDFGDIVLNKMLNSTNAFALYRHCYSIIPYIQACQHIPDWTLPIFVDSLLEIELNNFVEWGIKKFAEIDLSIQEQHVLQETFQLLKSVNAEQPQVGVHRDFHSRNLIVLPNQTMGVIDFQDAVIGPLTYDLGSLLRDYYVNWPQELVYQCVRDYHEHFVDKKISSEQFEYWFDVQGMQRHLKVIFIFARKYLRDGTTAYLPDILRALAYLNWVCPKYPALKLFNDFLNHHLQPRLVNKINAVI